MKLQIQFFLMVFASSILTTAFSPMFANASPYTEKPIDEVVKTTMKANWLRDCFRSTNAREVSPADAVNGKIFTSGSGTIVGEILSPREGDGALAGGGAWNCGDEAKVNDALSSLDYTPTEALCKVGYLRSGKTCTNGDGEGDFIKPATGNKMADNASRLYDKFWGKTTPPPLNNPMLYYLYRESFIIGCRATKGEKYTGTSDQKNRLANDVIYRVTDDIDGKGTMEEYIYTAQKGKAVNISVRQFDNFGLEEKNCQALADLTNQLAKNYSQYAKNNPTQVPEMSSAGTNGGSATGGGKTSCNIDGVGWIICPVLRFLAKVSDISYGMVNALLKVQPAVFNDKSGLYDAWAKIRNIANVAFVIGFLLIIYSQITSIGFSNYNIKRMLPKLIIAAILANTSYWICAIAVDISNLLGTSIYNMFGLAANSLYQGGNSAWSEGNVWTGLVGVALIGGTGALGFLSVAAVFSVLLPVIGAILTAVLVLMMRQALIVLLIVTSSLAAVMYIFPNLESVFRKYISLFKTLLLLPFIFGLIVGASKLAGTVITNVAGELEPNQRFMMQVLGAGVTIIPLFFTTILLKFAGSTLGGFAGLVTGNRLTRGASGGIGSKLKDVGERMDKSREARALSTTGGRFRDAFAGKTRFRRRRDRELKDSRIDANLEAAKAEYDATVPGAQDIVNDTRIAQTQKQNAEYVATEGYAATMQRDAAMQQRAGGIGGTEGASRALASAISTQAKLDQDNINAAKSVISQLNLSTQEATNLAQGRSVKGIDGGSLANRLAAQQRVVESGDAERINDVLDHASTLSAVDQTQAKELNNIADSLEKSSSKPAYVQPATIESMRQNGVGGTAITNSEGMIHQAIMDNVYSADRMTKTGRQEFGVVRRTTSSMPRTGASGAAVRTYIGNASLALSDTQLSRQLGKQRGEVEKLSRGDFS